MWMPNISALEKFFDHKGYNRSAAIKDPDDYFHEDAVACKTSLVKCGMKAICLCKHDNYLPDNIEDLREALLNILLDDEAQYDRYCQWSFENLKSIANRRNITSPKENEVHSRPELIQRLKETDSQYPFRLEDLPIEVRQRIYSMALCSNENETIDIGTPRERNLALLRTSRQVHLDASLIYYRNPYFRFKLRIPPLDGEPEKCFIGNEYQWFKRIGSHNVEKLGHVAFYFFLLHNEYNIHINLKATTGSAWRITTSTKALCPCRHLESRSLMQLREQFHSDTVPEPKEDILESVDHGIEIANKAIEDFRFLCHSAAGVKTTVKGLEILARAARLILLLSTDWHERLNKAMASDG
ncbi:hypothetical protein KCU93_g2686, partial [Aureobasidium melanogenum]